jgi:hypothetical protein
MKIRRGMTSGECIENKWFNMKYVGKYLRLEILLTHENGIATATSQTAVKSGKLLTREINKLLYSSSSFKYFWKAKR